jgi:hypothetical protein
MIDRLIGIGRECGMKINVNNTKMMRITRQSSTVQNTRAQRQPEIVEYYSYFGSMITNYARCTCEIKPSIAVATAAFRTKQTLFTSKLDLNLRNKLLNFYTCSIAVHGPWT